MPVMAVTEPPSLSSVDSLEPIARAPRSCSSLSSASSSIATTASCAARFEGSGVVGFIAMCECTLDGLRLRLGLLVLAAVLLLVSLALPFLPERVLLAAPPSSSAASTSLSCGTADCSSGELAECSWSIIAMGRQGASFSSAGSSSASPSLPSCAVYIVSAPDVSPRGGCRRVLLPVPVRILPPPPPPRGTSLTLLSRACLLLPRSAAVLLLAFLPRRLGCSGESYENAATSSAGEAGGDLMV